METKEMTAVFTANVKANIQRLAELFKAYNLAKLSDEVQEARIKECYAVALQAGEYHAAEWCGQRGGNIKPGDRITDPNLMYYLGENDFARLLKESNKITLREGITDKDGYYITPWTSIKVDARRALVDFIIDAILPDGMREQFSAVRLNIVQTDKLLDIVRPIVAA